MVVSHAGTITNQAGQIVAKIVDKVNMKDVHSAVAA